jgi:membrane protein YdbS with pleckstrin-like domain
MRAHSAIAAVLALLGGALAELILGREAGLPRGAILLPLLIPLLYLVFVAPGRRYRAWGYAMEADELRVAHGLWTKVETIVPLGRVQHIDVSQGPLERGLAVCRLVLHTAGTMSSRVVLPGLSRATAERMRDEIRVRIRDDAL